jgi:hypothetical protein
MSFVMYALKNISLTKAAHDVYSVTNSHIYVYISMCWFYSHNLIDLFETRLLVSSKSSKSSLSIWSVIQHYFWVHIFYILVKCCTQFGLFLLSFSSTGSTSKFFKISSFLSWLKRLCFCKISFRLMPIFYFYLFILFRGPNFGSI